MSQGADIRLVLSDVDGTLVTNDKVLTPAVIAAAQALRAAGIGLALTSSRPPFGMGMLIEPLGLDLPLAGCNGAVLFEPDGTVIETNLIAPDAAAKVVEFLRDAKLDVWLYTETEWTVPAAGAPHVARETFILRTDPVIATRFSAEQLAHAVKIVGVSDDFDRVADAEARAQALFGDTLSATRSASYFLDVTHPRATKGGVVEMLARRLDISTDQIATIGDMPNDVLMFRSSGFSIAMGNASDAVKAEAKAVTTSNQADGWAHAMRSFILPGGAT
jgi:Cof subfamily protein (haloacid dehalogenase superfamily)